MNPVQVAMKTKQTKLVLFDLDGTLIDTAPDLAHSMDLVMRELHLPAQGLEKVRRFIGHGVRRLVEDIVATELKDRPAKATLEKALGAFNEHYREQLVQKSSLYPGVLECLQTLHSRGVKLACVTNKPKAFTEPLLEHFQIDRFFDLVLSGDSLPKKKPDPYPLVHACQRFAVEVANSVMVGDSSNDILAARNAGMRCMYVSYGYSDTETVKALKPDVILDSFVELMDQL